MCSSEWRRRGPERPRLPGRGRRRWLCNSLVLKIGSFAACAVAALIAMSLPNGCSAVELCQVVQSGSTHISKCPEPSRNGESSCIQTETSTCSKKCPAGGAPEVECTGFCRCEPECESECLTQCCRLAYDLSPPGCGVHDWDCLYSITFYEFSTCSDAGTCVCGAGSCGFEVTPENTMVCKQGLGAPCMACPKGTYKETSGTFPCVGCSEGMSTRQEGSSSPGDCVPLCKPGSSSVDGFEPCTLCAEGTYQKDFGQLLCMSCSNGTTNYFQGSNSSTDCEIVEMLAQARTLSATWSAMMGTLIAALISWSSSRQTAS